MAKQAGKRKGKDGALIQPGGPLPLIADAFFMRNGAAFVVWYKRQVTEGGFLKFFGDKDNEYLGMVRIDEIVAVRTVAPAQPGAGGNALGSGEVPIPKAGAMASFGYPGEATPPRERKA
jgi:hypothetical protein